MTPPSATAAASARQTRAQRRSAVPARPHDRNRLRRTPAPRSPRRISGPVGGAAAATAPLALRAGRAVAALPDARIVDRLVRGRGWIALLGTLLIGIVAIQVSLLKLNAGIGRSVERAATLERVNGALQADIARLSSSDRIEMAASKLGMIVLPAGQINYDSAHPRADASRALAALRAGHFAQPPGATSTPVTIVTQPPATTGVAGGAAPSVPDPQGQQPAAGATATPPGTTGTPSPQPNAAAGAAGTGGVAGPTAGTANAAQ